MQEIKDMQFLPKSCGGIRGWIQAIKHESGEQEGIVLSVFIPIPRPPYFPEIHETNRDQPWAIKADNKFKIEKSEYQAEYDNAWSLRLEEISIFPDRELEQPKPVTIRNVVETKEPEIPQEA